MAIAYTIKRSSRRKKLTITVERDSSVVVHAPECVSEDEIREIVESKKRWIQEKTGHAQKYAEMPHPPGKELVNGESALYLGRRFRIELVDVQGSEVAFDGRFLIPRSLSRERRTVLERWYWERARTEILPRVAGFERRLGVKSAKPKIVDSRYRWGSCTAKANVTFNWRLIKAPMYVVDYVIVHELAHLREPNHTPRFWNIVRAQCPKAEQARAWLRENGQLLEEEI